MEYIALDGQTSLTELPSFQSMLERTSVNRGFVQLPWDYVPFLERQFSRIAQMFIPYSLLGSGDAHESPTWLPKRWGPFLGVALSVVGLIGSMFIRPRILFATLASFGFFWALPMHNNTHAHGFEAIYYIGLPLVFFTIVLLLAKRLTNRDGVIATASVIALLLFTVSSFQMGRVGHDAETARTATQELIAIRELTAGEFVTFQMSYVYFLGWGRAFHAGNYYLNSSPIHYGYIPAVEGGFIVMRQRVDIDALLTPQHQHLFLYDRAGMEAWYAAAYRSVASSEPLAREEFNLYFDQNQLYYLKEPCTRADAQTRFFLHVTPEDLDTLPDHRRQYRFDNLDFDFSMHGLLFDGRCLASVDLPQYDIASFRTGRIRGDGGEVWSIARVLQGPKLISAYPSIVSTEPIARSEFDLYIDGGKLYYVKEPCGIDDVQVGFFLHVVPADMNDLPEARREYGFDNLDFRFDVRGVHFDGKCAASVGLPQYDIARITTGQFEGTDRIWEVEFAPDARE